MYSRFSWTFRSKVHLANPNAKICNNSFSKCFINSAYFQTRYFTSAIYILSRNSIVNRDFVNKIFYSNQVTGFSHRYLSDSLDSSKETTIEKQVASALAFSNTDVLVNLIDTSLSSNSPISGNMLHSALSHLASFGYYEEIERWTRLILQRDSRTASTQKPQGSIGVRKLYAIRAYAAFYGGHLKDHLERCISEYLSAATASSIQPATVSSARTSAPTRVQLEESLVILFALLHSAPSTVENPLCYGLLKQRKLRNVDLLELGLLEWRALVLVGKFLLADRSLLYIVMECFLATSNVVSGAKSGRTPNPESEASGAKRSSGSTATPDQRSGPEFEPEPKFPAVASGSVAQNGEPIGKQSEREAQLSHFAFLLQHSGRSPTGSLRAHMSRALNSLILHDVHLFPAENSYTADRSASDADADARPPPPVRADPIAELVPRVNTAAVFTHLLRPERIFAETAQFDQILALALKQLLRIRVEECDWRTLRSLLKLLLYGRLRRLLPLLDPVELSELQSQVLANKTRVDATRASFKADPSLALRSSASPESPSGTLVAAAAETSRATACERPELASVEERNDVAAPAEANRNRNVETVMPEAYCFHDCVRYLNRIFGIINKF